MMIGTLMPLPPQPGAQVAPVAVRQADIQDQRVEARSPLVQASPRPRLPFRRSMSGELAVDGKLLGQRLAQGRIVIHDQDGPLAGHRRSPSLVAGAAMRSSANRHAVRRRCHQAICSRVTPHTALLIHGSPPLHADVDVSRQATHFGGRSGPVDLQQNVTAVRIAAANPPRLGSSPYPGRTIFAIKVAKKQAGPPDPYELHEAASTASFRHRRSRRPAGAQPDPAVLRLRGVHRAAAELRAGPQCCCSGAAPLVRAARGNGGCAGLAEFAAVAAAAPVLLLAPARAAAVLRRPVAPAEPALALRLSPALLDACVAARAGRSRPPSRFCRRSRPSAGDCPAAAPAALALAKLAGCCPPCWRRRCARTPRRARRDFGLLSVPAQ